MNYRLSVDQARSDATFGNDCYGHYRRSELSNSLFPANINDPWTLPGIQGSKGETIAGTVIPAAG